MLLIIYSIALPADHGDLFFHGFFCQDGCRGKAHRIRARPDIIKFPCRKEGKDAFPNPCAVHRIVQAYTGRHAGDTGGCLLLEEIYDLIADSGHKMHSLACDIGQMRQIGSCSGQQIDGANHAAADLEHSHG